MAILFWWALGICIGAAVIVTTGSVAFGAGVAAALGAVVTAVARRKNG